MLLRDKPVSKIEDRLDLLTGASAVGRQGRAAKEASILSQPLDDQPGIVQMFLERFGNISLLFEQADTNLTVAEVRGDIGGDGAWRESASASCCASIPAMIPLGVPADGRRCRCSGCCFAASAG